MPHLIVKARPSTMRMHRASNRVLMCKKNHGMSLSDKNLIDLKEKSSKDTIFFNHSISADERLKEKENISAERTRILHNLSLQDVDLIKEEKMAVLAQIISYQLSTMSQATRQNILLMSANGLSPKEITKCFSFVDNYLAVATVEVVRKEGVRQHSADKQGLMNAINRAFKSLKLFRRSNIKTTPAALEHQDMLKEWAEQGHKKVDGIALGATM
mmetsp:Transcript_6345/g.12571  ORF Transcript_6345/g.12571 Transcript_6345/m.12571 type:complete len:214 (-) Transcript_6345:42-683(-)